MSHCPSNEPTNQSLFESFVAFLALIFLFWAAIYGFAGFFQALSDE